MKTTFHQLLLVAALGLALLSDPHAAHAQRDAPTHDDKRAARQQANENLTPEQQQANRTARFQARMNSMTPEQKQRMQDRMNQRLKDAGIDPNDPNAMQKAQAAGLMGGRGGGRGARASADAMKQMMNAAGITDFDTQDAVIAYVNEQNKARVTLLQLAQAAATALQAPIVAPANVADTGIEATADAKVATTFDAYQTAVQAENARQVTALSALDAKIHYSTTPRIKAFLTLVGILNNDVLAIGGPAAIFAPATPNGAMQTGMNGQGQGGWNRGNNGANSGP